MQNVNSQLKASGLTLTWHRNALALSGDVEVSAQFQ